MSGFLTSVLGFPAGTGLTSNVAASGICVLVAYLRLKARQQRQHIAQIANARRQAEETRRQSAAQHAERTAAAERHHQEQLDRLDVQHEALKAHVTRTLAAAL